MNERINELIKQVGTDTGGRWVSIENVELLAKSIVWECGVALSPMLRDMVSRGQAFDLIKKHFGVEE